MMQKIKFRSSFKIALTSLKLSPIIISKYANLSFLHEKENVINDNVE